MTLCEEDCEYKGYDSDKKQALCECPIKINLLKISQISINTNKLYNKFNDIKNIINFNLMKCYKMLLTKDGILYNIGNYIIIFYLLCILYHSLYFIKMI